MYGLGLRNQTGRIDDLGFGGKDWVVRFFVRVVLTVVAPDPEINRDQPTVTSARLGMRNSPEIHAASNVSVSHHGRALIPK